MSLFNNVGGGGGGGGSYAPSFPGFPGPVYDTTGTNFNGVDGSVEIITVAPAWDVTVEPVANGSLAIDWQKPTQAEELGAVTYQAIVDGQAMLSAPGVVTGLDPAPQSKRRRSPAPPLPVPPRLARRWWSRPAPRATRLPH